MIVVNFWLVSWHWHTWKSNDITQILTSQTSQILQCSCNVLHILIICAYCTYICIYIWSGQLLTRRWGRGGEVCRHKDQPWSWKLSRNKPKISLEHWAVEQLSPRTLTQVFANSSILPKNRRNCIAMSHKKLRIQPRFNTVHRGPWIMVIVLKGWDPSYWGHFQLTLTNKLILVPKEQYTLCQWEWTVNTKSPVIVLWRSLSTPRSFGERRWEIYWGLKVAK